MKKTKTTPAILAFFIFLAHTGYAEQNTPTSKKPSDNEKIATPQKTTATHSPIDEDQTIENKFWAPTIHLQTSIFGDLLRRPNLYIGHFFSPSFALGLKLSKFYKSAYVNVGDIGEDDGSEIGLRGSYYLSPAREKTPVSLGVHLGLYYSDYKRGKELENALFYIFQTPYISRDEIKGLMMECMVGPLFHFSWFTLELLGGMQFYKTDFYTYHTTSGTRTERQPSKWGPSFVMEFNLGVAF